MTPPFLDTSYVVRYLTNTPPEMAAQAASIIDSEELLVLSEMVIAETAYVLSSVYTIPRPEIVDALIELVQRENLRLLSLSKTRALEALQQCRNSKRYSFTDSLVWAQTLEQGSDRIYSFDRRFPSQGLTVFGFKPSASRK